MSWRTRPAGRTDCVGVLRELLAENQDAVERRAQLVRHVRQELRLVARSERKLGRFLLERAPGELDFLVLALDFHVLLGEQLALLAAPRWSAAARLLRLKLAGELLRLLQQTLGAHRRLDGIQHHADDAAVSCSRNARCEAVKPASEASSTTALTCPSYNTGRTMTVCGGH